MGNREYRMMICEAKPLACPTCKGTDLTKYGKTKAGLQKYRCRRELYGRQFVAVSTHLIDAKVKTLMMNMICAGLRTKTISQAVPDISRRWICELMRRRKWAN